jgi:hypothetical protein
VEALVELSGRRARTCANKAEGEKKRRRKGGKERRREGEKERCREAEKERRREADKERCRGQGAKVGVAERVDNGTRVNQRYRFNNNNAAAV